MNLYVANIGPDVDAKTLRALFSSYGEVAFVRLMVNRDTGESRGFAFVDMPDDRDALNAMRLLTAGEHFGRKLSISKARPKP